MKDGSSLPLANAVCPLWHTQAAEAEDAALQCQFLHLLFSSSSQGQIKETCWVCSFLCDRRPRIADPLSSTHALSYTGVSHV
jgi:hypothetical protein